MKVLFAPDWRAGNDYQSLLSKSLGDHGIDVVFGNSNRNILHLTSLITEHGCDMAHIHWPEASFPKSRGLASAAEKANYWIDLKLLASTVPVVSTAHNLLPHNRGQEWMVQKLQSDTYSFSSAVIVHSYAAGQLLLQQFGIPNKRISVIPHGDLSATIRPLLDREQARNRLNLGYDPLCLMFGAVEPYKGIESIINLWNKYDPPANLAIVGKPVTSKFAASIEAIARPSRKIQTALGWLSSEQLSLWLAAADCIVFNYTAVMTSGAACLARSLGIPILLPTRLSTIELAEPHELVFRFDSLDEHFVMCLKLALNKSRTPALAESWRLQTSWTNVAALTSRVYKSVLP